MNVHSADVRRFLLIVVAITLATALGTSAQLAQTKLAFHSNRDLGDNLFEIYTIHPDGSSLMRLTFDGMQDGGETWSPDGRRIAFTSSRDGWPAVYVMNADGSNQQRLTAPGEALGPTSYSPDGTRIAFISNRDGNNELYVMNADGTNQVRLTNDPADDQQGLFSPDGTKIAFMSTRGGGNFDVYVMNANGSNVTRLTQGPGWCVPTAWSPDGTKIGYHAGASGSYQVFVMNADGSNKVQLTGAANDNSEPTWSPDGTKIAFLSSRDHAWVYNIWMMNPDGSDQHPVETESSQHYGVRWSPFCSFSPAPISGPDAICSGQSAGLDAGAGYDTYQWSTGETTRTITVSPLTSTVYGVTVGTADGCAGTTSHSITVHDAVIPTVSPSGPTTFCQGGSVQLTASSGTAYRWSMNQTTQSVLVMASGTYTVDVTDANGCTATSAPITVTVNPTPSATITPSGPTTFCAGGSVTLTANSATSYSWSNGASSQSMAVTSSGTYAVTVFDANGCAATSQPVVVTVNANPVATITPSGPTTFCAGQSVQMTASLGASYLWSTGATSQTMTATAAGAYSVTVTNSSGCSTTSAPITLTVLPATTITTYGPTSQTLKKNRTPQPISVSATGSGTISYQWYAGSSGDLTNPIPGATGTSFTPPTDTRGTFEYWVRLFSSACPEADSGTATVVVQ
jgi:Tol biopolymer transport system component